ncbi:MAG: hypothetical protein V4630_07455 [Pseudomonadota bacterium]
MTELAVLNGANAVAIGDGSGSNWEVFQFAQAQLVAPENYELSTRLRGQLGTDGVAPAEWPIGSTIVLLDLALLQIELPISSRGLARFYRIGVAARGYDDPLVTVRNEAFDGIGLRPYAVSHLLGIRETGDLHVSWKRRTRIDGDSWQSAEVPLGEDAEAYMVRMLQSSAIVAEYVVSQPQFLYTATMQAADGVVGPFQVSVAQVSSAFGPGPFRQIDIVA